MYATQRQQEILEYLNVKKAVSVAQLCAKLYASPATVRRDLAHMEQRGLLRRTHGGAVLAEGGSDEVSMFTRQAVNARQKAEIAKLAACFVKDSYNLFMDSSSTVCSVAARLDHCRSLSVVTNGLHCALALSQNPQCEVFLPAGRLATRSNSMTGPDTMESLSRFCADVAFVSCGGVSPDGDVTEPSTEQARVKLQMLRQSRIKILLCDFSKLGRVFFSRTCGIDQFDYCITDRDPGPAWTPVFERGGCELVYPETSL